jgi:hypothetical protein
MLGSAFCSGCECSGLEAFNLILVGPLPEGIPQTARIKTVQVTRVEAVIFLCWAAWNGSIFRPLAVGAQRSSLYLISPHKMAWCELGAQNGELCAVLISLRSSLGFSSSIHTLTLPGSAWGGRVAK